MITETDEPRNYSSPDLVNPIRIARVITTDPDCGSISSASSSGTETAKVHKVRFVDASYDENPGYRAVTVVERNQREFYAACPSDVILSPDDLVVVSRVGGQWWILSPC